MNSGEQTGVKQEQLAELTEGWWKTSATDKGQGRFEWDEEIEAVNALAPAVESLPEWAVQVRKAMPRYGFELCAHRWLDGLDDVLHMIRRERWWPSNAGHCGDVPGRIYDDAERRALAVNRWLRNATSDHDGLDQQVSSRLGEHTPQKDEAARCFVELVRAYFWGEEKSANELAAAWRAKSQSNAVLATIFKGEGFDSLLQNRCGFRIIDRLDVYIQIIGGDMTRAADRHGVCNDQKRFIYPHDPSRLETARGYLWGLYAYLRGYDAAWLREHKPRGAGAAIYALETVSKAGEPTPLRRWLVASLLKSTKQWCGLFGEQQWQRWGSLAPEHARDLPDVLEALAT